MAGLKTLAGSWAVVTAGHVRVGRAVALALAQARMNLIITYKKSLTEAEDAVAEFKALGVEVHALPVDLASAEQVTRLADKILGLSGSSLGVLVNNASVYLQMKVGDISADAWDDLLAVNLRAPFLLSQRLGLAMKANGSGHIINLGDWAGVRPYRNYLPYLVSKAGVIHMTRALALELAPEVQVNCVCPGAVKLPDEFTESQSAAVRKATPLQRLGNPEEIARAVRYFVESEFTTGSILMVDGGRLIA